MIDEISDTLDRLSDLIGALEAEQTEDSDVSNAPNIEAAKLALENLQTAIDGMVP